MRIFVCGTGTEIGKTHVACALCAELLRRGSQVDGRKPVESGYIDEDLSDAAQLAAASSRPLTPPLYRFVDPVSPHLAARREGATIDLGRIVAWLETSSDEYQVIESAGGLLSPLAVNTSNLDMAVALQPQSLVVVAPDRLGVLHDVAAALLALDTRQLRGRAVVVLSAPLKPDTSTGSNLDELRLLGIAPRATSFARASLSDPATHRAAGQLADVLADPATGST